MKFGGGPSAPVVVDVAEMCQAGKFQLAIICIHLVSAIILNKFAKIFLIYPMLFLKLHSLILVNECTMCNFYHLWMEEINYDSFQVFFGV